MRKILLAGAILALSACGGNNNANDANTMATDNMAVDSNMGLDSNLSMMNGAEGMDANAAGAMAANGSVDANTAAAMAKDANTHDPDTNLANGM